jgi:hypothetical protein
MLSQRSLLYQYISFTIVLYSHNSKYVCTELLFCLLRMFILVHKHQIGPDHCLFLGIILVFTLYSSLFFPNCTKQYHSVGGMQFE